MKPFQSSNTGMWGTAEYAGFPDLRSAVYPTAEAALEADRLTGEAQDIYAALIADGKDPRDDPRALALERKVARLRSPLADPGIR